MKISHLIVSILVLLAGGAVCYFSAGQQKSMNVLVYTQGGGSQIAAADATGLRALNKELEAEAARISGERAAAVTAAESARVEMNDQKAKCEDAVAALEAKKEEQKRLADELAKQQEGREEAEWITVARAESRGIDALAAIIEECSGESPDYDAAVEKIGALYKAQVEEADTLQKNLSKSTDAKTAAAAELEKQKAELARLNAINERFFIEYSKNNKEFTVSGVDTGWRYVTFNATVEDSLVRDDALLICRGDSVVTVVRLVSIKDGQVIAEIDEKLTAPGLRPAVGDRVVRLKPLGS